MTVAAMDPPVQDRGRIEIGRILVNAVLVAFAITTIFPMVWVVYNSLKTKAAFSASIFALPTDPTLDAYRTIFAEGTVLGAMANSIFYAVTSTVLIVVLAYSIAYALARFDFPGRRLVFSFFLLGLLLPIPALLVPVFIQYRAIGILDTQYVLLIPYTAFGLSLAVFLMEGYIRKVPVELDEAAHIDGANLLTVMFVIVFPICRPIVATVALLSFLHSWNEFAFGHDPDPRRGLQADPALAQDLRRAIRHRLSRPDGRDGDRVDPGHRAVPLLPREDRRRLRWRRRQVLKGSSMPTAYVTGAAGGLGRAICAALREDGWQVAMFDLDVAGLDGDVAARMDVRDRASVDAAVTQAETSLPPCDLLVNNAGTFSVCAPMWECDPDKWFRDIDVNLKGTFLMCNRVAGGMAARGRGRIVNIVSSGGVLDGHPFGTSYAASKTGVTRMTEGLAMELAPHGCQTFAVGPPAVNTAMTKWLVEDAQAREYRPLIREIFERGEDFPPSVVADCVVALASGRADALTGRYVLPHKDYEAMIAEADRIVADDRWVLRIAGHVKG